MSWKYEYFWDVYRTFKVKVFYDPAADEGGFSYEASNGLSRVTGNGFINSVQAIVAAEAWIDWLYKSGYA